MNEIDAIKQLYIDGKLSTMALFCAMKPHQSKLAELYPDVIDSMSRIYLYVTNLTQDAAFCNRSCQNRRLKSFNSGFMRFCGNQRSCPCNRDNSQSRLSSRLPHEQDLINQRRTATNIEKYGVRFASQLPATKEKAAATCIERYGTNSPTENLEIHAKAKATLMKNYGVEYPQHSTELATKAEQTWMLTRGVSRPAKDPSVLDAMKRTLLDRYGVDHNMKVPNIRNAVRIKNRTRLFHAISQARPSADPQFTVEQFIDGNSDTVWSWSCKTCNTVFDQALKPGRDVRCDNCNPVGESWGEQQIRQWLDSHNISYQQNTRKIIAPFELDFYIDDMKVAIEFNGIYWHSEKILDDKNYHFNKFKICHDRGIRLIQIWEHELTTNSTIIFSRLSHVLGFNKPNIIGARKCQISNITASQAREFFNQHHLQGFHASGYYQGAWYQGTIIAAISIGKARYTKNADWELTRFAIASGYSVPGVLSRLLHTSRDDLGSSRLVSYANLSWGHGNLYQQQGFQFSHFTSPNYFYFKNVNDVKSRIAFQKHKIASVMPALSESEIAHVLGYNRFFDAGSAVWVRDI